MALKLDFGKLPWHAQLGAFAFLALAGVGAFCFAVYVLLQTTGVWTAFGVALTISTTTHALTWLWFKHKAQKVS